MLSNKYEPLTQYLKRFSQSEILMTFSDIEKIIEAKLPVSARRHRAWWANNGRNNVAVGAWRRAGRKTTRVDMAREYVVFVQEDHASSATLPTSPEPKGDRRLLTLHIEALPLMVRAALERDGADEAAVFRLLEDGAVERRRRLLDRLGQAPATSSSSVDLIREERDAR